MADSLAGGNEIGTSDTPNFNETTCRKEMEISASSSTAGEVNEMSGITDLNGSKCQKDDGTSSKKDCFYSLIAFQNHEKPVCVPSIWCLNPEPGSSTKQCCYPNGFDPGDIAKMIREYKEPEPENARWTLIPVFEIGQRSCDYQNLVKLRNDIFRYFVPRHMNDQKVEQKEPLKTKSQDDDTDKRVDETVMRKRSASPEIEILSPLKKDLKTAPVIVISDSEEVGTTEEESDAGSSAKKRSSGTRTYFKFSPKSSTVIQRAAKSGLSADEVWNKYPERPSIQKAGYTRLYNKLHFEKTKLKNEESKRKRYKTLSIKKNKIGRRF